MIEFIYEILEFISSIGNIDIQKLVIASEYLFKALLIGFALILITVTNIDRIVWKQLKKLRVIVID